MVTQAMNLKKEGSKFYTEEEEDKSQKKLIEEDKHKDDY